MGNIRKKRKIIVNKPEKETLRNEILKFSCIHFQTEGSYSGNVRIETKSKTGKLKLAGFSSAQKLQSFFSEFHVHQIPYYISANSFRSDKRRKKDLFTLHNIVVDVDIHGKMNHNERDRKIKSFIYFLEQEILPEAGLPCPNTIVYTGRGIQLWWALEPVSYKFEKSYKRVAGHIGETIGSAIQEYDILSGLHVDQAASKNAAGLFRLPGTFNIAAKRYGTIEFLHEKRVDLPELYTCLFEEYAFLDKNSHKKNMNVNVQNLAKRREKMFFDLVELRSKQKDSDEKRDLILFCFYNSQAQVLEHDILLDKVKALNSKFKNPLPEREYLRYLSTSFEKKYLLSNDTIIEKLGLSEKEQELIGMHGSASAKRKRERIATKKKKEARDKKIIALAKRGLSKKDIAEKVKCSPSTVASVLKKNGVKTSSETKLEKIKKAVASGMAVLEVAAAFAVSVSYVYRLVKENNSQSSEKKSPFKKESVLTKSCSMIKTALEKHCATTTTKAYFVEKKNHVSLFLHKILQNPIFAVYKDIYKVLPFDRRRPILSLPLVVT